MNSWQQPLFSFISITLTHLKCSHAKVLQKNYRKVRKNSIKGDWFIFNSFFIAVLSNLITHDVVINGCLVKLWVVVSKTKIKNEKSNTETHRKRLPHCHNDKNWNNLLKSGIRFALQWKNWRESGEWGGKLSA